MSDPVTFGEWLRDCGDAVTGLATAVGGTESVVLPAVEMVRGVATAAIHHVADDLLAADLADRVLHRHRLVRVTEEFDTLAAREHGLIIKFDAQLSEFLQLLGPFDRQELFHDQPTMPNGNPNRRWMRALSQPVDLPAHAIAEQSPAFVFGVPAHLKLRVEVTVVGVELPHIIPCGRRPVGVARFQPPIGAAIRPLNQHLGCSLARACSGRHDEPRGAVSKAGAATPQ